VPIHGVVSIGVDQDSLQPTVLSPLSPSSVSPRPSVNLMSVIWALPMAITFILNDEAVKDQTSGLQTGDRVRRVD